MRTARGIQYVNSEGRALDLTAPPYTVVASDLLDWEWGCDTEETGGVGVRVAQFKRTDYSREIELAVHADGKEDFAAAMNALYETFGRDVARTSPGRLSLEDGTYMECYVVASKKTIWILENRIATVVLKVMAPKPLWVKEMQFSYSANEGAVLLGGFDFQSSGGDAGVDFQSGASGGFDFGSSDFVYELVNGEYGEAEFVMTIYGPVVNPRISIAGNQYGLGTSAHPLSVPSGGNVVIDSEAKTIMLNNGYGDVQNAYNMQVKEWDNFAPVPSAGVLVQSNCFFDMTLKVQRSEPTWIL
ncbi:MAG: hypothetical protein LBR00_03025 [Clostridiales Family XIII bacterium]|jgi:hypothetical protein|nr:hypothetical protein [Clostridiales Family XIII bacterium]